MNSGGNELVLQTQRHRDGYIIIPCDVPDFNFDLVLHTGRPLSYLSVATYEGLSRAGAIDHIGRGIYRIQQLSMSEQRVPDLLVRVSAGPGILGFDGLLGLQFLQRFSRVCAERDTGLLRLTM
ncbi:MAG TPA: hypothetical protein VIO16_02575 [Dehalococcoidia bacterium]